MLYSLKEHQEKRLFSRDFSESLGTVAKINPDKVQVLNESAKGKGSRKLIVKMEAIHTGRTKNFTFYTEEGLKAGLKTWTSPYNKPVLTHHNDHNGEPIGRILEANYSDQTIAGRPGLVFTCEISDPTAVEKVLDGRYQTVSIGASTNKVTCNVCGTDRTEDWCDHYPGEKYDEQVCHFIVGETYGREVSYVNTPADEDAGNRSVSVVDEDGSTQTESVHADVYQMAEGLYQDASNPDVNLFEHLNEDVKHLINSMGIVAPEGGKSKVDPKTNEQTQTPAVDPVAEPVQTQTEEGAPTPAEPVVKPVVEPVVPVKESETAPTNLSEMQTLVTNLVLEKSKLEGRLSEAESENNRLVQENATLVAEAHKQLAVRVVEMKLALRKTDVIGVDREEAVNTHLTRTKESLEDSLNDLLAESKQLRPAPNSVTNPGAGEQDQEENSKEMSVEEGLTLFKGMFSSKRKR